MSRKVLSVYDTRERWIFNDTNGQKEKAPVYNFEGTTIPASWMLGGINYPKGALSFDFNFTFTRNRADPFIGLLACHDRQSSIK